MARLSTPSLRFFDWNLAEISRGLNFLACLEERWFGS